MFLLLLFATFAVALGVSFAVMWLFTKPIDSVLQRIIADEISAAWSKYMKFAILVVGVSSGVPVHDLERYVGATLGGREIQSAASLSFDRWIFELYSAGIEALQGIALDAAGVLCFRPDGLRHRPPRRRAERANQLYNLTTAQMQSSADVSVLRK